MINNFAAIFYAYPNVVKIHDELGAFDAKGNRVKLDQAVIDAAAIEVATEEAWSKLRTERNLLLAETDYFALSDAILTAEMRDYRQALRDLPAKTSDPANPEWPIKP